MQVEHHRRRVQASLRARPMRTRSKSQNKVLLLELFFYIEIIYSNITAHFLSPSLLSIQPWGKYQCWNKPFQAAAGPGIEAEVNSWWKTPRPPPCSLSPTLTLRLQMHSSKTTLQKRAQVRSRGRQPVGAERRPKEKVPCKCVTCVAAADKVDSWVAQNSQTVQEEDSLGDKYYNKAKCFFDNISSDLKPRWGKVLDSVEPYAHLEFY